jgi:hypothetical protein
VNLLETQQGKSAVHNTTLEFGRKPGSEWAEQVGIEKNVLYTATNSKTRIVGATLAVK